jgi:hypothetical protein
MEGFKEMLSLPSIEGAIDVVWIHIQKPKVLFIGDYYSFKSKAYSMQLHAIVDHMKWFLNIFVGMLKFMNYARVLHLFLIYQRLQ